MYSHFNTLIRYAVCLSSYSILNKILIIQNTHKIVMNEDTAINAQTRARKFYKLKNNFCLPIPSQFETCQKISLTCDHLCIFKHLRSCNKIMHSSTLIRWMLALSSRKKIKNELSRAFSK